MLDNVEEKTPLLTMMNEDFVSSDMTLANDIPLRAPPLASHCHVADESFDYGARNRLIVVFILCLMFMIVEIIGRTSRSTVPQAHDCIQAVFCRIPLR